MLYILEKSEKILLRIRFIHFDLIHLKQRSPANDYNEWYAIPVIHSIFLLGSAQH